MRVGPEIASLYLTKFPVEQVAALFNGDHQIPTTLSSMPLHLITSTANAVISTGLAVRRTPPLCRHEQQHVTVEYVPVQSVVHKRRTDMMRRTEPPQQKAVVLYTGVVGLDVETSSLDFNTTLSRTQVVTALRVPPKWSLSPWLTEPISTDADFIRYALIKLKIFLDFAAVLPDGSAQVIRDAVSRHFASAKSPHPLPVKHFKVYARIREDGLTEGGYSIPERGALPFDITDSRQLDIFIQNLMRADIQQRIEALG